MSEKIIVVIRQLDNHPPVVSTVLSLEPISSKHIQIDDEDHYLESIADDYINQFKETYTEFNTAKWYKYIVNKN